jgi:hypothetical protein
MAVLRSRLFLSYSKADTVWRDAFRRQLGAMFVSDDLWIDCDSIAWGADWEREIRRAIEQARCALVLLTPAYLDTRRYARRELNLLLAQSPPLKLLPVLVEDCPWRTVEQLERTQLVRWPGGVRTVEGGREELAPLADSPHRDRSIVDICERARKEMGVVGQTRPDQIGRAARRHRAAGGGSQRHVLGGLPRPAARRDGRGEGGARRAAPEPHPADRQRGAAQGAQADRRRLHPRARLQHRHRAALLRDGLCRLADH